MTTATQSLHSQFVELNKRKELFDMQNIAMDDFCKSYLKELFKYENWIYALENVRHCRHNELNFIEKQTYNIEEELLGISKSLTCVFKYDKNNDPSELIIAERPLSRNPIESMYGTPNPILKIDLTMDLDDYLEKRKREYFEHHQNYCDAQIKNAEETIRKYKIMKEHP